MQEPRDSLLDRYVSGGARAVLEAPAQEAEPDSLLDRYVSEGSEDPRGFWESLTREGLAGSVPFGGFFFKTRTERLQEVMEHVQAGTETEEDQAFLLEEREWRRRPDTALSVAGGVVGQAPKWFGEFGAVGKGLSLAAKVPALAKVAGVLQPTPWTGPVARAGKAAARTGGRAGVQLAATEGVPQATGGVGPFIEGAMRDAQEEFWKGLKVSKDEAGQLDLALDATVGDFHATMEQMAPNLRAGFWEMVAEQGVPGGRLLKALQRRALRPFVGKVPVPELVKRITTGAKWDGVLNEWMEERYSSVLAAADPGAKGEAADIIPSREQALGELLGFGIIGGGLSLAGKALPAAPQDQPEPADTTAEAVVGEPTLSGAAGTPAQPGAAPEAPESPAAAPDAQAVPEPDEGLRRLSEAVGAPLEEVQAESMEQRAAVALGERLNVKVRLVKGLGNRPGAHLRAGEAFVSADANYEDVAVDLLHHELVHEFSRRTEGAERDILSLYQQVDAIDPAGLQTARNVYRTAFGVERYDALTADLQSEEALAQRAQELTEWIRALRTPEGARTLRRIATNQRGLFQQLVDAVKRLLRRLGVDVRTWQEGQLERIGVDLKGLRAARVLHEAIQSLETLPVARGEAEQTSSVSPEAGRAPVAQAPVAQRTLAPELAPATTDERRRASVARRRIVPLLVDASNTQTRYQGNKREFLSKNAGKLASLLGSLPEEADTVFDFYAGGGSYGLSIAGSGAVPSLKRVVVNEVDAVRRLRLDMLSKDGGSFMDAWETNPVLADLGRDLSRIITKHRSASPAALSLDVAVGAKASKARPAFRKYKRMLEGSDAATRVAIQSVRDVMFSQRVSTWERILRVAREDADRVKTHYDSAVARGVSVEFDSLDAMSEEAIAMTQGGAPSLVLIDPPYHKTSTGTYTSGPAAGHRMNSTEALAYNVAAARKMGAGNALVYHNKDTSTVRSELQSAFVGNIQLSGWQRSSGGQEVLGVYHGYREGRDSGGVGRSEAGESVTKATEVGGQRGVLAGPGGHGRGQAPARSDRDARRARRKLERQSARARVKDRVQVTALGRAGTGTVLDVTGSGAAIRYRIEMDRRPIGPRSADTDLVPEKRGAGEIVVVPASHIKVLGRGERGPAQERRQRRAEREAREGAEPRFAAAPPTDSPAFKRWFGKSAVVDENGEPLVVYHRTAFGKGVRRYRQGEMVPHERKPFTRFKPGGDTPGSSGRAMWFGIDPGVTQSAHNARPGDTGEAVLPVYLRLERPYTFHPIGSEGARSSRFPEMFGFRLTDEDIRNLLGSGHDGAVILGENGQPSEFVVFFEEQIKSATGNRGTFDAQDPDIRHAAKGGKPRRADILAALDAPPENWLHTFQRKVVEKRISLRRFQEQLRELVPELWSEDVDAAMAADLFRGKAEDALRETYREHLRPLHDAVRTVSEARGWSREKALEVVGFEWLIARGAKAANADLKRQYEEAEGAEKSKFSKSAREGWGTGMKDAEADAILKEYGGDATFQEIGRLWDEMNAATRQRMVDAQLITAEQRADWEERLPHWAPLRDEESSGSGVPRRGAGFSVGGPETKRRRGRSSRPTSNPLVKGEELAQRVIGRAGKNAVALTFLRLLRKYGNVAIRSIGEAPLDPDGNPIPPPEHAFSVKENGKELHVYLHERLARSMKNLGGEDMSRVMRLMGNVNRFLAQMNTAWDPEFMLSNLVRDTQQAGVHVQADAGAGAALSVIRGVPSMMRAGFRMMKDKPPEASEQSEGDRWFARYLKAGGKVSLFYAKDYEGVRKELERDLKAGKVRKGLLSAFGYLDRANTAVENALRASYFRKLVEMGVSEDAAAHAAKNLTVNFEQHGEWGPAINALYMFANAGIQGNRIFFKYARNPKVQRVMVGIAAFAMVQDVVNRMLAPDDDDTGENKYDMLPEHIKQRNMIFMFPNGEHFKLPLPWGYNVIHNIGRITGGVAHGPLRKGEAFVSLATAFLESFNPVGGAGDIRQLIAPTVADPFVDIAINENFAGIPIMPHKYDQIEPDSARFRHNVSHPAKWIAQTLNSITGGDRVSPGAIDISPESVEHVYEFAAGGVGRLMQRSFKLVTTPKADLEHHDIPFLRRFYGETPPYSTDGLFYDALNEVELQHRRIEDRRENGERASLKRVMSEHGRVAALRKQANAAKRRVGALRKAARAEKDDERRRAKEEQMRRVMGLFIRRFKKARGE